MKRGCVYVQMDDRRNDDKLLLATLSVARRINDAFLIVVHEQIVLFYIDIGLQFVICNL